MRAGARVCVRSRAGAGAGIKAVVLHLLSTSAAGQPVTWLNLREEPIVYVNGRPYVLRNVNRPFNNVVRAPRAPARSAPPRLSPRYRCLCRCRYCRCARPQEHTGISRARLEEMEEQMKRDLVAESAANRGAAAASPAAPPRCPAAHRWRAGFALVHDENEQGETIPRIEMVTEDSVQTPLEVYQQLQARGTQVRYFRIPVTDEQAPKPEDVAAMVACVLESHDAVRAGVARARARGAAADALTEGAVALLRTGAVRGELPDGARPHHHGHGHCVPGAPVAAAAVGGVPAGGGCFPR